MQFLFFLGCIFCTILEETVLSNGDIIKGMTLLDNLESSNDYFISYICKKYFFPGEVKSDAFFDLVMSKKYFNFVCTSLVLSTNEMFGTTKDSCKYLLKMGRKCYKKYLENGYNFIPKIYYKDKIKDYKNLLILVRSRDKKSLKIFFELLAAKKLHLKDHIPLLEYLASKNVPESFGYLGEAYFYGEGVEKSIDKSLTFYLKGKELGRDYISYNGIGKILMSNEYKDFSGAKEHFDLISDYSFNEADFRLFLLFRDHFQIEAYASFYLSRSVSLGYLPAIFIDGENYYKKGDYKSALFRLGALLEYDEIVIDIQNKAYEKYKNKEFVSCLFLLLMSIEMGSESSLSNAIYLLEQENIFKQDLFKKVLFKLYKKSEMSSLTVCNKLGDCYFYGKGIDKSYETAFAYYLTSASTNNAEGLVSLFFMYLKGLGTDKNITKAFRCLKKIQIDDRTYLLVIYIHIIFLLSYLYNGYIIATICTFFLVYRIYYKFVINKT